MDPGHGRNDGSVVTEADDLVLLESGRLEGSASHTESPQDTITIPTETDNSKASKSTGSRLQYRREYINPRDEVAFSEELGDQSIDGNESPYAILVTETLFTDQGKDTYRPENEKGLPPSTVSAGSTRIDIRSRAVIHALRTVIGYYPDYVFSGDRVRMHEPFPAIYHYRDELREYADQYASGSGQSEECKEDRRVSGDIELLLSVFEERCGENVREELKRYEKSKPTCTHDMLWMLFKPGTDAYEDVHDDNKMFEGRVIKRISFTYGDQKASTYIIESWCLQSDSAYVGAHETLLTIPQFAGEIEIAELRTFPCTFMRQDKHWSTHDERYRALVERGKLFYSLLKGPMLVSFDGRSARWPPTAYRGRAMVDMRQHGFMQKSFQLSTDVETANMISPRCNCSHCTQVSLQWSNARTQFVGYNRINPLKKSELSEHQQFLCADGLFAYLLKQRTWILLRVEGFSLPQFRPNLIETLVIPTTTRNLLQSLCQKFTSKSTWSADFVEGKGEGNIVLLHGKPGVGKTYTAECVAEEIQRPLISLTSADIGTDPTYVEQELLSWFELARVWSAVLLLDEADVFLERRSASDLVRNNLVAIFLRTLEYYKGILFLTTNRIGTFDEAFLSRIDVPIYFPPLSKENRVKIWNTFFTKLEKERQDKVRVSSDVRYYIEEDRDLLGLEWNGREIRSGFQTAVALAEIEGLGKDGTIATVRKDHIATVVQMSKEFKNYLRDLHQQSADDLASSMRLRHDPPSGETKGTGSSGPY